MKIMMSDGKEVSTAEGPTYIVTPERDDASNKGGITKKHMLIAVSIIVVVAIILSAILVGVHMFSETQKDIVKFSLQFKGSDNQNVNQDVVSDPNDNVVVTKVSKNGQDAYIVNDFNKGIQVTKLTTASGVNCYVAALNRTIAMNPVQIAGADSMSDKSGNAVEAFVVTDAPVADRSFLTKKAQDLCQGVSVYWVTRQCGQKLSDNSTDSSSGKKKRDIYVMSPYNGLPGLGGCCYAYWACSVTMVESIQGSYHTCTHYLTIGTCCGSVAYPYCQNYYYAYWYTPGLVC